MALANIPWRFIATSLVVLLTTCFHPAAWAESRADLSLTLSVDEARHFLVRTGIGAAPSDVVALRTLSRKQAIDRLMTGFQDEPELAMPDWVREPVPHFHARQDMDDNARVRFNNRRDAEVSQLRQWWTLNLLDTSSPQTERMVLFWHDLFATSYNDIGKLSLAIARQNQTFRQLGMGSWEVLLKAMIRDPALLEFLDSGSNHKGSPNENLARELLELFVLGEGNYEEGDIREAARSLTGHDTDRIHDLSFVLKTWRQDRGNKTLFGVTGMHDGDDLVDLALDQTAAAQFLVSRFWHAFVADANPDKDWVARLAARFRDSGYSIAYLYRDVLESEAFWSERNRGAMIKSPIDLIAGTARTLEYPKAHWRQLSRWQAELGMELFAPPNVSGWKEGAAFITPGNLLNRYRLVDDLIADPDPSLVATMRSAKSMSTTSEPGVMMQDSSEPSMMMSVQDQRSNLLIRMAAEDYQGAAQYQVSLYKDRSLLWRGDQQIFNGGHDTEMYGRIRNQSELGWQLETVMAPLDAIAISNRIVITYLNDASGPGGDRNLYVGGVQVGDEWLPGSRAEQQSDCIPRLAANAWKLHCEGSLTFARTIDEVNEPEQLPAWRASAAHVQWANENPNNKSITMYLTLDHLVTPLTRFHTLQFSVRAVHKQAVKLRLESFGCWPSCVSLWPECAWSDDNFPVSKTLSFSWLATEHELWKGDHDEACHLNRITEAERALVATLWRSLPSLTGHLENTNRGRRFSDQLSALRNHLEARAIPIAETPFANRGGVLQIDKSFAPLPIAMLPLPGPAGPLIYDIEALQAQLAKEDVNLENLLLPQLNIAGLPGISVGENASAVDQLEAIVKHPLFQVK